MNIKRLFNFSASDMPLPGRPPSGGTYSVRTYSLRSCYRMFNHTLFVMHR